MKLRNGDPQSVIVYPMIATKTRYNTWRKTRGKGVLVEGVTVEPFGGGTMGNLETDDQKVNDQFTVRGHGVWPGGVHSIVKYEGEEYDQVGKVKNHGIGQFTRHFQVRIAARGAEVK